MFNSLMLQKTLVAMEDAQKERFVDSGKSFREFFTSREELDQDAAISCIRHLVMFAEMGLKPEK